MSPHSVEELTESLSTFLEERTLSKFKVATDLVVYADETTSVGGREELALYVSYFDSVDNVVHTDFISIVHVTQTTAAALTNTIKSVFLAKGIEMKKVHFSGLDGTNAMSGEVSGLQRRLRNLAPHMLYMNCRNHRLALVLVHMMKQFEFISDIDSLLEGLWKLFHYSNQKFEIFKAVQMAEGLPELKMLKVAIDPQ